MSIKCLWDQVIVIPGYCEQWLLWTMVVRVVTLCHWDSHCTIKRLMQIPVPKVTVDFKTGCEDEEKQMPLKEEIKTSVRNAKSLIDPLSPSVCLSWFEKWEKKASHIFAIKTQPGFSRHFISKSSLDGKRPPMIQAVTLKHLMDVYHICSSHLQQCMACKHVNNRCSH